MRQQLARRSREVRGPARQLIASARCRLLATSDAAIPARPRTHHRGRRVMTALELFSDQATAHAREAGRVAPLTDDEKAQVATLWRCGYSPEEVGGWLVTGRMRV